MPDPISSEDFAALYSQCHVDLLRYVMTLLPNRSEAEDVVQDTARALWKKADDYNPDQPFWPWAKKFAYFEVLRHRKKHAIRSKYFSEGLIEQLAEERDFSEPILAERRRILVDCVNKLNERGQCLIRQRYVNDQSLDHIARKEGRTANALYILMHRVRSQLRDCVDKSMKREGLM